MNRSLSYKTTLFVGDEEVNGVEVVRDLTLMIDALNFNPYFRRVIFENEEPALVAFDYYYSE